MSPEAQQYTRKAAARALKRNVSHAIVWTVTDGDDRYLLCTDTTPGLDLHIADGVATPLDEYGPDRMREAMADDEPRVGRIVTDMMAAMTEAREQVMA